jgi:PAS domain S-box-containing protein
LDDDSSVETIRGLELQIAALRARLSHKPGQPHISGLSQREALLVESNHTACLGSWAWELASGDIQWSKELYRILGYDPDVVKPGAEAFFSAVHQEDRDRVQRTANRLLHSHQAETEEFRIVRPDGSIRHVHLEGTPIVNASGQKTHLVGAMVDLTESLAASALLQQTVAELRIAQRQLRVGSYVYAPSSSATSWSIGMYELLGVDEDQKPSPELFFECVHPDDRNHAREMTGRILATGLGVALELRMIRKDGSLWYAHADSVPQRNADGSFILRGIVQDITERKLGEERRRHSEKMIAVGTLAGGIAHDFNNYLAVLMGELTLLRTTLAPGQHGLRSMDAIQEAAERCAKLTNQLLTLGRKRSTQPELFELGGLLRRMESMFRSILGERTELVLRTNGKRLYVLADPTELEHALINLAVNARDALTAGGSFILTMDRVEPSWSKGGPSRKPQAMLEARDTGAGILPEVLARVFEPFFTTKAVGKGTGLGLATVHSVMERAGGHITVESEVGRGTAFRLYLPLEAEPAEEITAIPFAQSASVAGGKTILVVEDMSALRSVIASQLLDAGYQVQTAENGQAALDLLATMSEAVDAVLSDVVMPVLDGFALRSILAQRYPHIYCLLMTGYAEAEFDDARERITLRKPFSYEQLTAALGALWTHDTAPAAVDDEPLRAVKAAR